jgi:hypothetical protein
LLFFSSNHTDDEKIPLEKGMHCSMQSLNEMTPLFLLMQQGNADLNPTVLDPGCRGKWRHLMGVNALFVYLVSSEVHIIALTRAGLTICYRDAHTSLHEHVLD